MDTWERPRGIMVGLDGSVFALGELVAVKIPRDMTDIEGIVKEQENIDLLIGDLGYGRPQPTPYLIPYLFKVQNKATFMMRAKTDLRFVLIRDYVPDMDRTTRWMGELCAGVAFLERKGVVHGDLRPDNVLIDHNDHIRLHDFGHTTMPIGAKHFGISEPFGRQLGPDEGVDVDKYDYGNAGPRTECFALGSIYYCLLRGYHPYAKENFDSKTLMRKFSLKEFPVLGEFKEEDKIISRCWNNHYKSVAELEQVFRDMKDGTEWYRFEPEDEAWLAEQRRKCEEWAATDALDVLWERQKRETEKHARTRK